MTEKRGQFSEKRFTALSSSKVREAVRHSASLGQSRPAQATSIHSLYSSTCCDMSVNNSDIANLRRLIMALAKSVSIALAAIVIC